MADLDRFNALDAENLCDRGGEVKRDVEIMQALVNVSRKTCGSVLYLVDALDARALKGEAARHYHAYVSATENNAAARGHLTEDVDEILSRAGGVYAGGSVAVDEYLARGALAASARDNDGFRAADKYALRALNGEGEAVSRFLGVCYKCVYSVVYSEGEKLPDESSRIFGTCQTLAEADESESVMHALLEDAAELVLALYKQHIRAVLVRGYRGRKTCRAAAEDYYIISEFSHCRCPPFQTAGCCRRRSL